LSSDPLLAQLLHQVLSQITAMRSGAEILQTETDLSEEDRRRFVASINREAQALSDGTRAFISYFEESMVRHRSVSPSLEVADLIVSDSSAVTAFLPLDQELIVGKRRSITAIRGMDPRDFSQPQNRAAYTNEYGIVHYKAILDVAGVPWFLSDSGVYSLRGPFDLREESWAIHDHIEHLDPTRIQRSFAVHLQQRGQAIFWVPRYNGTHMDLGLVAHPGQGRDERAAWSLWEGPELTAAAVGWDVIEGEVLYLGDANGFVYRESLAYMDDTTPVRAVYRSGPIDIGLPNHLKVLREVGVEAEVAKVTQITVTAITDRDRAVDTRTVTLPAPSYDDEGQDPDDPLSGRQIRRSAVYVAQRGIQHQIKLEHADGDEFRLSGVELRSYAYGTSRGRKV
ncbi:MAG UNVERIFIED_CONTAM: hypothetical protein LOD86_03530, partial [Thermobifida fusca]